MEKALSCYALLKERINIACSEETMEQRRLEVKEVLMLFYLERVIKEME